MPKEPVIEMRLPMDDPTIDRVVRHRLRRYKSAWRWDDSDHELMRSVGSLPAEAGQALVDLRQQVFVTERAEVVRMLTDIETVGRAIAEDRSEQ